MATRTTAVGTQSGSDYLTAAEYNDAAGGWIRSYSVTSNQGSITSVTDLTGLTTGAWTTPLRKFRFEFDLTFQCTNAGEQVQVKLLEDGADLKRWDFDIDLAANPTSVSSFFYYSPTNASHTYKLQAAHGGAGTITLVASASGASPSYPAQFVVTDCGPQ